jgi:hypothetical protein
MLATSMFGMASKLKGKIDNRVATAAQPLSYKVNYKPVCYLKWFLLAS